MSKKNKVVYSNIQPNTKEAGIWVNTNDGNIKIEKDGKWVDDGGNGSGGSSADSRIVKLFFSNDDASYELDIEIPNNVKNWTNLKSDTATQDKNRISVGVNWIEGEYVTILWQGSSSSHTGTIMTSPANNIELYNTGYLNS